MSEKCHYIRVRGVGRVLIPGCMAVAVSGDLDQCTCNASPTPHEEIERLKKEERKQKR